MVGGNVGVGSESYNTVEITFPQAGYEQQAFYNASTNAYNYQIIKEEQGVK